MSFQVMHWCMSRLCNLACVARQDANGIRKPVRRRCREGWCWEELPQASSNSLCDGRPCNGCHIGGRQLWTRSAGTASKLCPTHVLHQSINPPQRNLFTSLLPFFPPPPHHQTHLAPTHSPPPPPGQHMPAAHRHAHARAVSAHHSRTSTAWRGS
eukprot:366094-Chlamydomonas_euryale.AAC.6